MYRHKFTAVTDFILSSSRKPPSEQQPVLHAGENSFYFVALCESGVSESVAYGHHRFCLTNTLNEWCATDSG